MDPNETYDLSDVPQYSHNEVDEITKALQSKLTATESDRTALKTKLTEVQEANKVLVERLDQSTKFGIKVAKDDWERGRFRLYRKAIQEGGANE